MKQTILIAEDSGTILFSVSKMLESEGFKVLTAEDGKVALKILETTVPDLIIADIMMPHVDGYTLYKEVHTNPKLKQVPFIFLTAKSTRKDVRFGKEIGADDYIVKPFDHMDLLAAIRGKLHRMEELHTQKIKEIEDVSEQVIDYLSHKIRKPLSTIRKWSRLLQDPTSNYPPDELTKIYSLIEESSSEIDESLEKFTSLAKLLFDDRESSKAE